LEVELENYLSAMSVKVHEMKVELADNRRMADKNLYSEKVDRLLKNWREELVEIYADSLSQTENESFSRITLWGKEVVKLLVELNLPLDVAINEIYYYRDSIGLLIKNESKKNELDLDEFYEIISKFDHAVDYAIHWLSLSYVKVYESNMSAAAYMVRELSVPTIKISKEVGVIPLIGDIDTLRAQQIMETALTESSKLHIQTLIIDLSGVPIVDTMVASRIFQVIASLQMTGVEVIVTGIRPEIAQTMVALRLSFDNTKTFGSLYQAIESINKSKSTTVMKSL
jgi:rsbT co-antagonist protein RsbR